MNISDIRGNEDVRKALAGMVGSGKVPHAIMFHEDDGGGAFPIAMEFLDLLYGGNPRVLKLIHPDVHFVFPTAAGSISLQYMEQFRNLVSEDPCFTENRIGEALGIEGRNSVIAVSEAKHILDVLSLSALEGGYRTVLVYLPEKMNQEASNRLLKLIEEPPVLTQFVFITHSPEKVLQTISSRCQRIRVVPQDRSFPASSASNEPLFDNLMKALVSRDLLSAVETAEEIASLPSRENVKAFCKFAGEQLRQVFLVQQGLDALTGNCGKAHEWAAACRKSFPRQAMESFDRAVRLVDRNVNVKIVLTDLADRLYTIF